MSVEQTLKELPKLTPEEHREIFEQVAELEGRHTYRPTLEKSVAIDEAVRSLGAGQGIPAAGIQPAVGELYEKLLALFQPPRQKSRPRVGFETRES